MQDRISKGLLIVEIAVLTAALMLPRFLSAETAGEPTAPGAVQIPPASPEIGTEQLLLSLSHPEEPGFLIIQHHKGRVSITGYDGEVVVVNAALRYPDTTGTETGVRPLPGQALKLHAIEKNNVVNISTNSHERTIDLEIRVPHSFSLRIDKYDSGVVSAHYLEGEMEITSSSGSVRLTDITGSAVISTVDGNIFIRFAEVTPHVPMAFTSVGGNIDVAFPQDVSAVVKMRTDHGEIMSDFDIEIARRQAETEVSRSTGIQRAFLEQWTHGTLGGGGAQLLFRSYNGNIIIRKIRNVSPDNR